MQIDFSLFAEPIEIQLTKNGYKLKDIDDDSKYNKLLKAWNMLGLHSIATQTDLNKMAKRIVKNLSEDIEKIGEENAL